MEELDIKKVVIITILLIFIAFGSGILVGKAIYSKPQEIQISTEEQNTQEVLPKKIKVYVAGEVKKPDVYELEEGSIVKDAILLAGGATENANLLAINLAKRVNDEDQIIVPTKSLDINDLTSEIAIASSTKSATGKININTASKTELMELPGIGETKAQAIIDFRTKNGPFKNPHDIVNVSGIGEKTYENIKDLITT
ncbi:MAG: ComEA family DNA-binding protein [Caldisericaceae bacterium]